ncbi:MAG: CBS domain-containing protein [Phycisphaerae bacterium]
MITAKAVMTPWILTATKNMPVLQALDIMLQHWISGLPVVDDDKNVIGIITEKDLLELYDKTMHIKDMTVKDIMTTDVVCFDEGDSLDDVCTCLMKNDFRRVPVLSNGKLVGIISRPDITRGILEKIKRDSQRF